MLSYVFYNYAFPIWECRYSFLIASLSFTFSMSVLFSPYPLCVYCLFSDAFSENLLYRALGGPLHGRRHGPATSRQHLSKLHGKPRHPAPHLPSPVRSVEKHLIPAKRALRGPLLSGVSCIKMTIRLVSRSDIRFFHGFYTALTSRWPPRRHPPHRLLELSTISIRAAGRPGAPANPL